MPWIIDTDIFIEGERGNVAFVGWLQSADGIATADVVRGEFLIGAYAVADEAIRQRGVQFYSVKGSVLGIEYFTFFPFLSRLFVPAPISFVSNLVPSTYGHAANRQSHDPLLPRTLSWGRSWH